MISALLLCWDFCNAFYFYKRTLGQILYGNTTACRGTGDVGSVHFVEGGKIGDVSQKTGGLDNLGKIADKEKALVSALKDMLGIQAKVHLVEPKSITRSEGKAVRVIDKRKLYG